MMRARTRWVALATCAALFSASQDRASATCPEQQATPQVPTDPALCAALDPIVRKPSALGLNDYQAKLGEFLRNFCHRDERSGWKVDKRVRDTGPWIGTYANGAWKGTYFGTHAPVLVWYSPDMYQWLKTNRPGEGHRVPAEAAPVPDGAIIVKEIYRPPAAACAKVDPLHLRADNEGAAIMVRDSRGSHDGWFWGWFGWKDWQPDGTLRAQNRDYPFMGFGQYCTNCHSSAKDNQTFSSLKNIKGEAGEPLVYLSHNFFLDPSWQSLHMRILRSEEPKAGLMAGGTRIDPELAKIFSWWSGPPHRNAIREMPSASYDNVWVKAGPPTAASQFVTSDQCLGCHSAGGTGLHYDMTEPGDKHKLANISPYGTWSGSPMALSGRDPIFFSQLASETETFHPESASEIQDVCFGCHGVQGQRQLAIDRRAGAGTCDKFQRDMVNAIPDESGDPVSRLANYGALARDGVSCAACHRMVLGKEDTERYRNEPQNRCVEERQASLNPGAAGFAKTFTGSFLVGPPDQLYGQFEDPKQKPMHAAIGSKPVHRASISSSEMCGSCHTVHLPVLHRGRKVGHFYEQTTYAEWAFSDYRTGATPDGPLPSGAGAHARSCQDCHMPKLDARGDPYRSKIAAIQEYTNYPQAEYTLEPKEIDLPERAGFAKHTLQGLNIFLLKMAQQFADILGLRRSDPMMGDMGVDPLVTAQEAMLDQAAGRTASIAISDVEASATALSARVTVTNRVGHKFPSGVAFRRAFIELDVLDADGKVLWASGRTNGAGAIVDDKGAPIAGELWWAKDCSARIDPDARIHQPHYQVVTRQDQAQIYEELLSAPPDVPAPVCGVGAQPAGPLTTSFLSGCAKVKDNRLLPAGFMRREQRIEISRALGAGAGLADESGAAAVGDDADYVSGGGDSLLYRVPLADIPGTPAAVQATIYYQATPPYYLQDRFCSSRSDDTKRLFYMAGNLRLADTPARDWKLEVGASARVQIR